MEHGTPAPEVGRHVGFQPPDSPPGDWGRVHDTAAPNGYAERGPRQGHPNPTHERIVP